MMKKKTILIKLNMKKVLFQYEVVFKLNATYEDITTFRMWFFSFLNRKVYVVCVVVVVVV